MKHVVVVGAGFTGLSAAMELVAAGVKVTVLESQSEIGGLASAFDVQGEKLDRFYHHWFTNDQAVMDLIADLGLQDQVQINPTNTGVYYGNKFFKLSTPLDLLKFSALPFFDRIRLGLLTLKARKVKDWLELEDRTAAEWLREMGGENVYRVVWEPLLRGKFGDAAEKVSAVWFWNKLKLRGGSRGKGGEERLAYYTGGFVALAEAVAARIKQAGGEILTSNPVTAIREEGGRWFVDAASGTIEADAVIATTALPLIADMVKGWASADYLAQLNRIEYLSNVCLVLEMDRSLSSTYWLNVNDPSFPFVAVIEHTNFASPQSYGGRHIVYLSKYLPHTDKLFLMSDDELLDFALPYLQRMFPALDREWIKRSHVWRARYSQPLVEKRYSSLIPAPESPKANLFLASMAQIYPEDRGTNYAVREGRKMGKDVAARLAK